MKSNYDERQEARRERYEDLAEKNAREGAATIESARKMAEGIPFGQPILVGHHSEQRDRNYRERIHNKFERGFEALDKSKYHASKAASVGKGGISSDDPNAIDKLREKLARLEADQAQMKAVNAAHKKFQKDPASLDKTNLSDSLKETIRNYKPRYSWEPHPIAPYELTNNGAEIRRVKARIEQLERQERDAEALRAENPRGEAIKAEEVAGGLRIEQNAEENRVFLFFPGKPSDAIRKLCKRSGFRWAPSVGAWSRHLSAGAVWDASEIKTAWLKEQEPQQQ
jgi:hypothetical protein